MTRIGNSSAYNNKYNSRYLTEIEQKKENKLKVRNKAHWKQELTIE